MRAISIRQPWAWAIVTGSKDIENRTWKTKHRGPILIHASKTFDYDGLEWLHENQHLLKHPLPDEFDVGGIVGQVEIIDCVSASTSPFFSGPNGFVLDKPKELDFKACKGRLMLFEVEY